MCERERNDILSLIDKVASVSDRSARTLVPVVDGSWIVPLTMLLAVVVVYGSIGALSFSFVCCVEGMLLLLACVSTAAGAIAADD